LVVCWENIKYVGAVIETDTNGLDKWMTYLEKYNVKIKERCFMSHHNIDYQWTDPIKDRF